MKIAVCIKRVPDSETRVKIAAGGKSLDEAGVKFVLNPYDEFALEEALRRKEKAGTGEVGVSSASTSRYALMKSCRMSVRTFCARR